MSKIEQLIAEIEEYIDSCKYQTLSNTKIIVNRDELEELLADLKHCIPDEIKKYQRIIANRDAILRDAQEKADEMVRKANEMTSTLVSEHEIMQQAYREANAVIDDATRKAGEILDRATTEANDIRNAAMDYTDESLAGIQEILSESIESMTVKYDSLLRSLESSLDITTQNRKALRNTPAPEPQLQAEEPRKASYFEVGPAQPAQPEQPVQTTEPPEAVFEEFEAAPAPVAEAEPVPVPEPAPALYAEEETIPYEEPIYGKHNPQRITIGDALATGNLDMDKLETPENNASDVEEITDFNLDISNIKG